MICENRDTILWIIQIIIACSFIMILFISVYIVRTKRIQIYAYKLIFVITICQSLEYISIFPFKGKYSPSLESDAFCDAQILTVNSAEMIVVLANTNLAFSIYRGLKKQSYISNRQMVLISFLSITLTQILPIFLDQVSTSKKILCEKFSPEGGRNEQLVSCFTSRTLAYILFAFFLVNTLIAMYYCLRICLVKRKDISVSAFIFVFPAMNSVYLALRISQIFLIEHLEESFVIWSVVSILPGITYVILFYGIVSKEVQTKVEGNIQGSENNKNTGSRQLSESFHDNKENHNSKQKSASQDSESIVEFKLKMAQDHSMSHDSEN